MGNCTACEEAQAHDYNTEVNLYKKNKIMQMDKENIK